MKILNYICVYPPSIYYTSTTLLIDKSKTKKKTKERHFDYSIRHLNPQQLYIIESHQVINKI